MKIFYKQKNTGFTLIELMVATSIFIVVMLTSMSSLFALLDTGKSSRALRFAMDNVNFSMESMTRSIRMGTNYYCVSSEQNIDMNDTTSTRDCSNIDNGTFIAFMPQGNTTSRVGYKLHTDGSTGNSTLQRCDVNSCVDIVSPDINIEKLQFIVRGSANNDNTQASVYVIMKGTAYVKGVPTSFAIQTMASQRNF
jgi:prepilin-type N-terminal cleavage/methylation domain-containing protein